MIKIVRRLRARAARAKKRESSTRQSCDAKARARALTDGGRLWYRERRRRKSCQATSGDDDGGERRVLIKLTRYASLARLRT